MTLKFTRCAEHEKLPHYLLFSKIVINSNYLTIATRSCAELLVGSTSFCSTSRNNYLGIELELFLGEVALLVAESHTLCTLDCIRIPLSRGRMHVTMRTKSCTGKRLYEERNRIECNLSPVGYTAFCCAFIERKT